MYSTGTVKKLDFSGLKEFLLFREKVSGADGEGEPGLNVHKTDNLHDELRSLNFIPSQLLQKLFY